MKTSLEYAKTLVRWLDCGGDAAYQHELASVVQVIEAVIAEAKAEQREADAKIIEKYKFVTTRSNHIQAAMVAEIRAGGKQ